MMPCARSLEPNSRSRSNSPLASHASTMPVWRATPKTSRLATLRWQCGRIPEKPPDPPPYDRSTASTQNRCRLRWQCGKWPLGSQRYDQSPVIRPQDTMALRHSVRNPYDHTSAKSTMSKKFVTCPAPLHFYCTLLHIAALYCTSTAHGLHFAAPWLHFGAHSCTFTARRRTSLPWEQIDRCPKRVGLVEGAIFDF